MNPTSLKAGLLYFALVFGAGFCLGALRVTLLVPRFGERLAELAEMPLMLVVVVIAARFVSRKFSLPPRLPVRLTVGFLGLTLLVICELLLAVILQDRSLTDYIASRDPVSGNVYLGMLLVFAMMPALVGRSQNTLSN